LSHPTINTLAFSRLAVNAGLCSFSLTSGLGHVTEITGSVSLMRSMAEKILAATGTTPPAFIKPPRKPGTGKTLRIKPERLAIYRAVQARVQAGAKWVDAAKAEGVNYRTVYFWHWQQMRKAKAGA
jgi:hypothetical protein